MIREYFRMKKSEWKIKAHIYGTIAALIDNQQESIDFLKKLYVSLKDVPVNEFQDMFVSKVVELAKEKE